MSVQTFESHEEDRQAAAAVAKDDVFFEKKKTRKLHVFRSNKRETYSVVRVGARRVIGRRRL